MTRQIKFRAYNKEKELLVYDNEDDSKDYWDGVVASNVEMANAILKGDRYIWMQFTGLLDKNGKEIYEGDIVKSNDGSTDFIHEVKINVTGVWFGSYAFHNTTFADREVIGDIYTSPHLLTSEVN